MKRSKLIVFVIATALLLAAILFSPKDNIIGTWQNNPASISDRNIMIEFQVNGIEVQRLKTAQGMLIVKGNYTLDTITLKHTFFSASLNGKTTKLPATNVNIGYRCKVAGNDLELDSRALAADIPNEHYLPLEGKQILLSRIEDN